MTSVNISKLLKTKELIGSIRVGKKADFPLVARDFKVHAAYIKES